MTVHHSCSLIFIFASLFLSTCTDSRIAPSNRALPSSSEAEERDPNDALSSQPSPSSLLSLSSNKSTSNTANEDEDDPDELRDDQSDQGDDQDDSLAKEVIEAYTPVKMDWFKGKDLYMFTPDGKRDSDKMMKLVELREAFLCRNVLGFEEDACLFDENKSPKVLKIPVEKDGKTFDCSIMALGSVTLLSDLDFTISCTALLKDTNVQPSPEDKASMLKSLFRSPSVQDVFNGNKDLFNAETHAANLFFQKSSKEVLDAVEDVGDGTKEGLCEATAPESKCWDPIPGILFDTNFYTNAFAYQKKLGFDCSGMITDAKTLGISVGASLFSVLRGIVEATHTMHLLTQGASMESLHFWVTHSVGDDYKPESVICCGNTADAYSRFFEELNRKKAGSSVMGAVFLNELKKTSTELDFLSGSTNWAAENYYFEQKTRTEHYYWFLDEVAEQETTTGFCSKAIKALLMANEAYWVSGAVSDIVFRKDLESLTEGVESVLMNLGYAVEHLVGEVLKGFKNRGRKKFFGGKTNAEEVWKKNVGDGLIKFGKYTVRVKQTLAKLQEKQFISEGDLNTLMQRAVRPFLHQSITNGIAGPQGFAKTTNGRKKHSRFHIDENVTVKKMFEFGERMLKHKKSASPDDPFSLPEAYMTAFTELFESFPGPQITAWDVTLNGWRYSDWENQMMSYQEDSPQFQLLFFVRFIYVVVNFAQEVTEKVLLWTGNTIFEDTTPNQQKQRRPSDQLRPPSYKRQSSVPVTKEEKRRMSSPI
uniref:Uncharacterized protein n=1 Tax=Chromera velia CCMP2878 TaxID=1169474 RepID=A0A0G4I047_9ALVE|eukprot:Cvel_1591.t1-p1 / transcript=Cvel_1591.t1 / gene=Cvel_1591 / organism=Chromera_velia_CCMP2878 / gene_product=hypothetical protein / transcript_product=hypothetical protein / location=Cvel_scaffold57:2385-8055(-) / protein_length=761 / sequence_SO=supercontig / SO=protein_coding / is_pseudo=false